MIFEISFTYTPVPYYLSSAILRAPSQLFFREPLVLPNMKPIHGAVKILL